MERFRSWGISDLEKPRLKRAESLSLLVTFRAVVMIARRSGKANPKIAPPCIEDSLTRVGGTRFGNENSPTEPVVLQIRLEQQLA
jgi:hypothetical protein